MTEFLKARRAAVPAATPPPCWTARAAPCAAYQREMDLAGIAPELPGLGRLGVAVHRPARHGLGHHARLHRPVEHAAGHAGLGRPGIAEALIATAIGLFAAIPAVVAYNRFTNDIDRLSIRFDSFVDEFLNILQRQVR